MKMSQLLLMIVIAQSRIASAKQTSAVFRIQKERTQSLGCMSSSTKFNQRT
jgi:hypothetical protein